MNEDTRLIMKLLNVDKDVAREVQNKMGADGFDFSECTMRQFNKKVREMYEIIKLN